MVLLHKKLYFFALYDTNVAARFTILDKLGGSCPVPWNAHGSIGQHRIVVGDVQVRPLQRNCNTDGQQTCHALDHLARIDGVVFRERLQSQLGNAAIVQVALDVLVPVGGQYS